jgi:hypothetical protein
LIHVLNPQQLTALLIVGSILAAVTLMAVTAIVCTTRQQLQQSAQRTALIQQMLERGLSADEVARVLDAGRPTNAGTPLPHPSEVVVEQGGDWHPAFVLQTAGEGYYVHYIGNDMSENEWVTADRVRFPAGSPVPQFAAEHACFSGRNGVPVKEPMPAEL